MALAYTESANLMSDMDLRGRIKVSCLNYAKYILGEAAGTSAHNSRYKWAQNTYNMPDQTAQLIHPAVVMTDQVQQFGSTINDADLDAAVQSVVNAMI